MPGKPYSPHEMGILIRGALAGDTYAAIASRLKARTIGSVSKQCYGLGFYRIGVRPTQYCRKATAKPQDIVDRMGEPVCRPRKQDDLAFQAAMGRAMSALRKIGETP